MWRNCWTARSNLCGSWLRMALMASFRFAEIMRWWVRDNASPVLAGGDFELEVAFGSHSSSNCVRALTAARWSPFSIMELVMDARRCWKSNTSGACMAGSSSSRGLPEGSKAGLRLTSAASCSGEGGVLPRNSRATKLASNWPKGWVRSSGAVHRRHEQAKW
ncbi:hypothetical protein CAOG_009260 [Capsaspora owczarzaki ATCC 30864]|uniref:Uncharacterized protein n=1 Tax=Capsaspora owczarzaki (strain ATCC 30864) TaxID=595528 RepID=A0A0D2WHU1_CAPO3|nr:hypothetical protein CAOG_009260 [Capsaspora owczarzaki ATCC 30864]